MCCVRSVGRRRREAVECVRGIVGRVGGVVIGGGGVGFVNIVGGKVIGRKWAMVVGGAQMVLVLRVLVRKRGGHVGGVWGCWMVGWVIGRCVGVWSEMGSGVWGDGVY